GGFQTVLVVCCGLVCFFLSNIATTDQRINVETTGRGLIGDQVVHARLCHRRVVAFVVTTTTVGDQVDDDVAVETLTVFVGQLGGLYDCFRIVPIDVNDRSLDGPGHIGGVRGRAGLLRWSGETNLGIDDDMHGIRGAVAAQPRDLDRAGN